MEDFLETLESEGVDVGSSIRRDYGSGALLVRCRDEDYGTPEFWRMIGIDCPDRLWWSCATLIDYFMISKRYREVAHWAGGFGLKGGVDSFLRSEEEDFDYDPDMSDVECGDDV